MSLLAIFSVLAISGLPTDSATAVLSMCHKSKLPPLRPHWNGVGRIIIKSLSWAVIRERKQLAQTGGYSGRAGSVVLPITLPKAFCHLYDKSQPGLGESLGQPGILFLSAERTLDAYVFSFFLYMQVLEHAR